MGKSQRDKGGRNERKIVTMLASLREVFAHRIPMSGAYGKFGGRDWKGDIKMVASRQVGDQEFSVEVKSRATDAGFKVIKQWLGENNFLVVVEDRCPPLVVMPWCEFAHIINAYEPKSLEKKPGDNWIDSFTEFTGLEVEKVNEKSNNPAE